LPFSLTPSSKGAVLIEANNVVVVVCSLAASTNCRPHLSLLSPCLGQNCVHLSLSDSYVSCCVFSIWSPRSESREIFLFSRVLFASTLCQTSCGDKPLIRRSYSFFPPSTRSTGWIVFLASAVTLLWLVPVSTARWGLNSRLSQSPRVEPFFPFMFLRIILPRTFWRLSQIETLPRGPLPHVEVLALFCPLCGNLSA